MQIRANEQRDNSNIRNQIDSSSKMSRNEANGG